MAGESKSQGSEKTRTYTPSNLPYGLPYGYPFYRAYRWPYFRRPIPFSPYGGPFFVVFSPLGVLYTAETARKQELEALKAQAMYIEDALTGIREHIAELENETKE